jgi:hypothetical protein
MKTSLNKLKPSRTRAIKQNKQASNKRYYQKKKEKITTSSRAAHSKKANYSNVETFLSSNINKIKLTDFHEIVPEQSSNNTEVEMLNDKLVYENEEFTKLFDDSQDSHNFINDENEIYEEKNQKYDFIYDGSRLTLKEFNLLFRWVCQKMRLSKINRNFLLTFIKTILPANNLIPSSYYLLLKSLKRKTSIEKKSFKICSMCYDPYKKGCENVSCKNLKKQHSIDALVFDFEYHLKFVVTKFWKEIQNYKGNLLTEFINFI